MQAVEESTAFCLWERTCRLFPNSLSYVIMAENPCLLVTSLYNIIPVCLLADFVTVGFRGTVLLLFKR